MVEESQVKQLEKLHPVPPTHHPRVCDQCGEPYARRNLIEAWTLRNVGSRIGWSKVTVRICCACLPQRVAERLLILTHFQPPRALRAVNGGRRP